MHSWARGRTAVLLGVVGLAAGCGAGGGVRQPAPVLPRSLASGLAARSDALATALEQGDSCRAAQLAAALHRSGHEAVAFRRVPKPFRSGLLAAVDSLAAAVPGCAAAQDQGEDHGNRGDRKNGGHGHGKHNGHGHGKHKGTG